jgi:condensin complex subunit 1
MVTVMFEIYTKKLDNVTNNDSRLALQLLVICSNANPSIARANEELLEKLCFSDEGDGVKDSRVFTLTLEFLMNVHADKPDELYTHWDGDHEKVTNVLSMFRKFFLNDTSQCFDEVCSKTFQYIYKMCNLPNVISQELIKDLWNELLQISQGLEVKLLVQ